MARRTAVASQLSQENHWARLTGRYKQTFLFVGNHGVIVSELGVVMVRSTQGRVSRRKAKNYVFVLRPYNPRTRIT
jgi:hypothetical protein